MAASQQEDFKCFLARKKGDYCSKFPFLTERQIVAKLKRIWSSQNATNISGVLNKKSDNVPRHKNRSRTTPGHRVPNKGKHGKYSIIDKPPQDKENSARMIASDGSELTTGHLSSSSSAPNRTSCYDFPITETSPPDSPSFKRPVLKSVPFDPTTTSMDLLTPLSQSDMANKLIGSLNKDHSVNSEELTLSNSQSGHVSRHSMRLRSSQNKPHPLVTAHSQCVNRIKSGQVQKRRVQFAGEQVLTFEPKLPVTSKATSIQSECIDNTSVQSPCNGQESNMVEAPCQSEVARSNSTPKGSPGSDEVVPFVSDNELSGCQGDDTLVASSLVSVDGGNMHIPRNKHLNGFNQSSELESVINKHQNQTEVIVDTPQEDKQQNQTKVDTPQEDKEEQPSTNISRNIRKTGKKRSGGKHRRRRTRTASKRQSVVAPPCDEGVVDDGNCSQLPPAKKQRFTHLNKEQDEMDTPPDQEDTLTIAQDETTPDEPTVPATQFDMSVPANQLPTNTSPTGGPPPQPPSILSPVAADPLCDMFLPLTPEREKYGFFKDVTSFYVNSLSERRVFRSSASVAASNSATSPSSATAVVVEATNSRENAYCMFDDEADIFM